MKFPTNILVPLIILVCAVAIAWLNDFTKPKRAKAKVVGGSRDQKWNSMHPGLWLLLCFTFALMFWLMAPRQPGPPRPPPQNSNTAYLCLALFLGCVLIIVVTIVRATLRDYDRAVARAYRRAAEGDVDGAIIDLRRVIDEKGMSVNRSNGLGVLLTQQQKWDEALAAFQEGDRFGGEKDAINRWHIGLALGRLGRGEEARPYLRKAAELGSNNIIVCCQVCRMLMELGYRDDAQEVFGRVEESLKNTVHVTSSLRKRTESEVDECRALVQGKPARGANELFDEL